MEQAQKIRKILGKQPAERKNAKYVMNYGKYKGENLETIFMTNKGYLEYLSSNLNGEAVEKIREFLDDAE